MASFIDAAPATFPLENGNTGVAVVVPSSAAPGDTLLLVIPATAGPSEIDLGNLPAGWTRIARLATPSAKLVNVLRRVITATDPTSYAIPLTGQNTFGNVGGVLLVYRGLDETAAIVDGGVNERTAVPDFMCPSLILASPSDLYLGIVFVTSHAVAVTAPTGATERFQSTESPPMFAADRLEVFELAPGVAGATGIQTARIAGGTNEIGLAAAIALRVRPALQMAVAGSSSALQLGDLALGWIDSAGAADIALIDQDLASETGMRTAILLSLFTDRRAEPDDVPPSGDPTDVRGWWADQFAPTEGDRIGSRLWLLDRAPATPETARRAEEYVREALQWMLDDRVVSSLDVAVQLTANGLLIDVTPHRPGKDPVSFRFAHVWDATT